MREYKPIPQNLSPRTYPLFPNLKKYAYIYTNNEKTMGPNNSSRVSSIDVVRGLAMVIMALDHILCVVVGYFDLFTGTEKEYYGVGFVSGEARPLAGVCRNIYSFTGVDF
ncbi:MAG: hypothetical protein IPH94_18310 [Saprospiraceae bacterium]|nr:hypothetical protein [Saprospiraceae bacterium]